MFITFTDNELKFGVLVAICLKPQHANPEMLLFFYIIENTFSYKDFERTKLVSIINRIK